MDFETVPAKLEVADDLRDQKSAEIGRRRGLETGGEFFGHRRAPDHLPAFEDQDLLSSLG